MNKSVIICLLALCLTFQAQAQRYLPGQKGVQITAGTVNGFTLDESNPNFAAHAGAAFSTYTKNGNRWVFGGEFLGKCHRYKSWRNPQMQFTGEGGYYLNFLSDRSKNQRILHKKKQAKNIIPKNTSTCNPKKNCTFVKK